mmetsp:Transcript_87683/g.271519  ORF Transcript_87683/g.271519 Transcript_87683/m.271519 type:complete len:222 (+) Transcript_87683:1401-2066(+)
MSERTSSISSVGPGTKSVFSVKRLSCPERMSRTSTAWSSSTCTACLLPPSRDLSLAPRKTRSAPVTTRISPVCLSSTLTYSPTLRSMASSLSPSRSSSSGPGTTICSPRWTVTLPVRLLSRRTYSKDFNVIAFLVRPSTSQVGSRNSMALPFCTHRWPVDLSLIRTYSSSWREMAAFFPEGVANGPEGYHTHGPFTSDFSPVSRSSTTKYSVLLRVIASAR